MTCKRISGGFLCETPTFKPGDLPPQGYFAWHEWAEAQRKAGIKQTQCGKCGLWQTPQELSDKVIHYTAHDKRGRLVQMQLKVCTKCVKEAQ